MGAALRKTTIEIDWKINNRSLHEANKETDSLVARAGKAEQGFSKTNRSIDGTTSSLKNHNSTMKQASDNVVQFQSKAQTAFNGTARAAQTTGSNVVHMNSAIGKSQQSVTNMGKSSQQALNNTKNNVVDLRSKFGELGNGINSMADKASSGIEKGISKPLGAVKGVLLGIGASAGLAGLGGMVNAGIGRLSAIEDAKLSLDVMMGDSGKAQKFMDQVLAFAKTTPYAFQDLATNSKNLLAYGMDPSKVVPTMKAIGDLAAASGKGSEGINTLSNSFGKMQVMGKVSMEQLNTVTEAGVPALKILANANNKSVKDMQKAISDGKVESTKAIAQMVEGIQKGSKGIAGETVALGGVMEKLKGTWKGSLDSMKSAITSTMATLFTPIKPHLQEGMKWFATQFKKLPDMATNIGNELEPAIGPAKKIIGNIGSAIRDDVIPAAVNLGKTLGPGFISGGVGALKTFGFVLEHIVAPPLKATGKFIESHPESFKRIGKFAAIAVTALLGFKLVSAVFGKVKSSVDRLIASISKIGPATVSAATQSNVALVSMDAATNVAASKKNGSNVGRFAENMLPAGISRTAPKLAQTGSLFSKATTGLKGMGSVGKLAGAAGVVGVGLSAIDLIGMNKQNAGNKIGGFGGSAGGMAGGAAIGTLIAPGIGTAIGGAIGAFAGSALGKKLGDYLQKEGPGIFEKMKVGWKNLSSFAKEHPILGSTINNTNAFFGTAKKGITAISQGAKAVWAETKTLFDDPFKVDAAGKGVSKNSAKAMNNYMGLEQELQGNRTEQIISGKAMSEKDYKASVATHNKMSNTLVSATDSKTKASNSDWDKLVKSGVASKEEASAKKSINNETSTINKNDIKKNAKELTDLEKQRYEDQKRITKNAEDAITAIKEKARKRGVKLTKDEKAEIKKIEDNANTARQVSASVHDKNIKVVQDRQRKEAAIALSKSAKEQKIILGNLEGAKEKMSATSAAKVVKNSAKARDGVVKEANKEFKQTKAILDEKRYVTGEISEKEYRDLIKKAKKKKEGSISEAEKMHQGVVDQAQKQAKGHLKEVDWETGQTLSKWEQFKRGVVEKAVSAKDWVIGAWNNLYSGTRALFSVLVNEAVKIWDSLKSGIFGKINPVLSGVNKVLDALGSKMQIPLLGGGSFSVSQENKLSSSEKSVYRSTQKSGNLAMNYTGANNASGQIMAGEEGFEIAYDKASAQARILGANGPEITHVNPNTRILNHAESKKMMAGGLGAGKILPGFAKGNVTPWQAATDLGSNIVDKVKDIKDSVWDWVSDPVGNVTSLISKYAKFGGGIVNGLGSGLFSKFGSATVDYVKEKIGSLMSSGLGPATGGTFGPRFGSPFRFTSGYGPRVVFGKSEFHKGVDYGAPSGTPLPAQHAGLVTYAGGAGGFGNLIKIRVAQGVETLYGHLSKIIASNGAVVRAGQIIGLVGSTGRSTGPHVHYQVNAGGSPVNPGSSIGGKKEPSSASSGDTAKIAEKKGLAFKNGGRPPVNKSVLVGEEGPELFETDSPGTIHTASQTRDLLSNRKGNGEAHYHFDPTINITVQGSNADAKGIASEVKGALYEMFQQWIEQIEPGEVY
ncbi:peptidoglycan DD-metalloendopeptidase family protein [Listeria booriae]|uniref:peptidoglycan DD-metalloendopeptidase family protein n=1 Tax=Listeria booriae TaxID=1552123 RepID=UPI001624B1D4|nr:peptidoglycan DD-metalloendopeptidase family protein [Listeria booriae]MBC1888036.1 peptidoglycan DD-metalloendopeptidase family protein [Listeria booriae]